MPLCSSEADGNKQKSSTKKPTHTFVCVQVEGKKKKRKGKKRKEKERKRKKKEKKRKEKKRKEKKRKEKVAFLILCIFFFKIPFVQIKMMVDSTKVSL